MAGTTGKGRGGMIVGINVTPMVDIVLVLLVIMMVSATFIVSQSLKVDLPSAKSSDGDASSVAAVVITKTKELYFNKDKVTEPELESKLRAVAQENKATTLIISADAEAPHGSVIRVMDLARIEGLTSFAVNVEKKN